MIRESHSAFVNGLNANIGGLDTSHHMETLVGDTMSSGDDSC